MIRVFKTGGIFIAGLIVGAVLMNLLAMHVRTVYREVIRIDMQTEQKHLAVRAARQGDKLRALSHRWNAVDAEAEDGFRIFRKARNRDFDSSFFLPFQLLALNVMQQSRSDAQEKGSRISEGINRAHLAFALEALGADKEAEEQLRKAMELTRINSTEEARNLILRLRESETTDAYLKSERAVLESD